MLMVVLVGLFIGFLAPFGMDDIPNHLSISYWVLACMVGYGVYAPIIYWFDRATMSRIAAHWHRVALGTFISSFVMALIIPILTWIFFATPIHWITHFFTIFPKTLVIGSAITVIALIQDTVVAQRQKLMKSAKIIEAQEQSQQKEEIGGAKQLMAQIPIEKRGELLCLEMADHYIKIYTDKGHHLVLMRFKDALTILGNYPGVQTHRSWWVAYAAIEQVKRANRKVILVLTNGQEVPVSRTHSEVVKAAGF